MASKQQQEATNTEQNDIQQEETKHDARSMRCNTLILEYVLYKKVDVVVEDLLRELPFDRENVRVRVRLIINHLSGLWKEVEQEDRVDGDRIGLIINSVTKLVSLIEEKKQAFSEILQDATFSADDYSKKIKKWLTVFINAETYEHKYQSLESLVKYFNILGNYVGEPKLYSLTEQTQLKQTQEEVQQPNETEPEQEEKITVDSLPDEPCTYLGLKNSGISTTSDSTIFITERLFNARKSKTLTEKKQEEVVSHREKNTSLNQSYVEDSENEHEISKKRKSTTKPPSPKKKKLSDRQSDARRVVIVREFASSEEDEDIPIANTVKSHLARKSSSQRPRSKSDTNGKSKKKTVFEESSSEEETERTLFKPRRRAKDRQKKVFWTDDEVNALLKGFKMYGTQWARILAEFKKTFHPHRDSLSLRDKYRNMEKYGQI